MKTLFRTLPLLIMICMACSCVGTKLETTYNNQESQIDKYLSNQPDSLRVVRNGGSNRLVRIEGEGPELERDGFVSFYYAGYTFSGSFNASNLFITNHQATAEQSGWNLTDAEYELYEISMQDARLLNGLREGLYGVQAGEECEILFSGKYGFGNEEFGIIPANSALLYKIWVVAVSND